MRHLILKQLNDADIQEQTTKLNKEAKVPVFLQIITILTRAQQPAPS